jgi:hypothetical protein
MSSGIGSYSIPLYFRVWACRSHGDIVDAFEYRDAYFILAGGFLAIGVAAALVVWLTERNKRVEPSANDELASTAKIAAAAVETARQVPSAIAAGTTEAPARFRGLANVAGRNWPLAVAAGVVVLLLGGLSPDNRYDSRLRSRF